tara:strand:- start:999 stop:2171 length:1173 start_codon:yes stop_codon:yes gene_type:complete
MGFIYTTALDKIRRMTKRIKIIPGGTSAGKTYSILPILIDKCINEENLEVSVVSESIPHLKRGAIKDFLSILKSTNRYNDDQWNISNSKYTFTNGSYVEFFSADSAVKLRGARRNVLYVNECNNITRDAYTQLAMRTSADIYLDYNPTGRFWIKDVMEEEESEILTLTYKDNEALPQTIVDFLESKRILGENSEYWNNWCRVYLDGLEGRLEGVVYDNWDTVDKVPQNASMIGVGMDFGFSNDPTAVVCVYRYNGELIVDEILYKKGLLNSDLADLLKTEDVSCEIIADSAEPKSIAELRKYGFKIRGTKKGKDSIIFGINLLQDYKIKVTKRSKNIISEFTNYEWKKDKEGNPTNIPIDAHNHGMDALRYLAIMKLGKKGGSSFNISIV